MGVGFARLFLDGVAVDIGQDGVNDHDRGVRCAARVHEGGDEMVEAGGRLGPWGVEGGHQAGSVAVRQHHLAQAARGAPQLLVPRCVSGRLRIRAGCGQMLDHRVKQRLLAGVVPVEREQCTRERCSREVEVWGDAVARQDPYTRDGVVSKDGTVIGYRTMGRGPGLVLLHGGLKSSQDFTRLGQLMADDFTVYLPDRRGRGLSGPFGDDFSLMREVEDMRAIISETGARYMFGLSAGALVTLRTAREVRAIEMAALYEAPFSIGHSVPTGWVPGYERRLAEGRIAAAVVTIMKGLGTEPLFNRLPRWLLVPAMALIMRLQGEGNDGDVTIRDLVPTMHYDLRIIGEMSDTLSDYENLETPVLLMRGTKAPSYFRVAVEGLAGALPQHRVVVLPGLGHDGPEDDGGPDRVARELRDFFRGSGG